MRERGVCARTFSREGGKEGEGEEKLDARTAREVARTKEWRRMEGIWMAELEREQEGVLIVLWERIFSLWTDSDGVLGRRGASVRRHSDTERKPVSRE